MADWQQTVESWQTKIMDISFRLLPVLLLMISVDVLAEIPGLIPESKWDLNGYVNYRINGYFVQDEKDYSEQSIQQRFNYEYRFSPYVSFNAGMRNRLIYSDVVEEAGYSESFDHDAGYMDLSTNLLEEDKILVNSQFDRLYLTWQRNDWLIRGGRFRINWGMSTIWNPNDIFNTYSVYDTDYVERPGTDGFLIRQKLNYASGFELVISPAKNQEQNGYAGRYYFNYDGWDAQILAGRANQDNVVGIGFSGSVNDAGVRGETSFFKPANEGVTTEKDNTVISSLELDYSFTSQRNWGIKTGVLHTSDPYMPDSSVTYLSQSLSVRTLSFTEFTGYAEVGFDLTSLNRSSLSAIYYQEQSLYLCYTNRYSLSDNWQLTASIQHFNGSESSLFGQSPATIVYTMIRWDW